MKRTKHSNEIDKKIKLNESPHLNISTDSKKLLTVQQIPYELKRIPVHSGKIHELTLNM